MTANLLSVCPPHNLAVQKQLSNYKNTKETTKAYSLCSEMLHKIRYNKDLNAPENAQHVLDWFISKTESINNSKENLYNKVYGITFASVEKIAEETGYSVSTIEKGFTWLRRMGFIKTRRTRGTAYKVFEAFETVTKIIKNYIKALFKCIKDSVTGQSTGLFTGHFTGLNSQENASIPCESKDENQNEPEHIKAFKEKPLNKTINKRLNRIENDNQSINQFKKFGINKDLATALESNLYFQAYDEQTQNKIASKIQLAFIKSKSDFKDRDCIDTANETLRRCIFQYEKQPQNVKEDYFGAFYKAMYKELIKLKQEPQQATGQPQQAKPKGFFGMIKAQLNKQQEPARENVIEFNENGQVIDTQPQPQQDLYSDFMNEIEQDIANSFKTTSQPKQEPQPKPKKIIRSDASYLPDWFEESANEWKRKDEERKAKENAEWQKKYGDTTEEQRVEIRKAEIRAMLQRI